MRKTLFTLFTLGILCLVLIGCENEEDYTLFSSEFDLEGIWICVDEELYGRYSYELRGNKLYYRDHSGTIKDDYFISDEEWSTYKAWTFKYEFDKDEQAFYIGGAKAGTITRFGKDRAFYKDESGILRDCNLQRVQGVKEYKYDPNSNNDHSPETSTTKLWYACSVSKDAQGIPTSKWGYIDAKGNFAIPASYMEAYEFSCGYALVRVSETSIYFVDEKNNIQNAPDFDRVANWFYYDHVRYMTSSSLWGMLNKNFEVAIQPAYYDLGDMTGDGLVYFKQGEDSKYGYLDKNGETKIAPMYDDAWNFDAGYAVVNMGDNYGVINKSGEATISLQSKRLRNLGGERIGFMDESSYKFGMMDAKGNIIVQPIYDDYSAYGFTDFDYMVVGIAGKYGYIDKNGKDVLAIQYADATPFIENKAFIARTEDAAYECIDPKGKTLFTLEKDQHPVSAFHNGLCLVLKDTQTKREYKYINEKGAAVYSWSIESSNTYLAPAKAKGANRIDIDQYMAGTKWGYRAEKR